MHLGTFQSATDSPRGHRSLQFDARAQVPGGRMAAAAFPKTRKSRSPWSLGLFRRAGCLLEACN